jgi:hypothetical protein
MKSPESTSHEFGLLDLLLFVLAHAGMHSSGRIAASGQLVANLDNREA